MKVEADPELDKALSHAKLNRNTRPAHQPPNLILYILYKNIYHMYIYTNIYLIAYTLH